MFIAREEARDFVREWGEKGYHKITGPNGECDCGFEGKTCAQHLVTEFDRKFPLKVEMILCAICGQAFPKLSMARMTENGMAHYEHFAGNA